MRFRFVALMVAALVIAVALPVVAGSDDGDGRVATSKLIVKVSYKTPAGKAPLAGVEVFAMIDGAAYYDCTNAKGKAVFTGLPAGGNVAALATGPSAGNDCENGDFLNPDTGKKMYTVFYDKHHGVRVFDSFHLSGEEITIKMVARTPKRQKAVCGGLKATQEIGTNGDDIIAGTPGDDVIIARGGNDVVQAGEGNDYVCGGSGADELFGESGSDWLWGEGGGDDLDGGDGYDWVFGGPGSDACVNGEVLDSC